MSITLNSRTIHLTCQADSWKVTHSDKPVVPMHAHDLVVDTKRSRVWVQGKPVWLTRKEFEVLAFLVRNRDRVVSRSELLYEVWGYKADVATRTVDNLISRLRKKIRPAESQQFVHTHRGFGYSVEEGSQLVE